VSLLRDALRGLAVGTGSAVTNFFLGLLAGAIFSAVVTIVAVRDADVQKRLGLFPTQLALPPKPDNCIVPARTKPSPTDQAGSLDMLFDSTRRLGPATRNVTPRPD
jgi:hypothetical protein